MARCVREAARVQKGGLATHRRPTQGSSARNSAGFLKELLEALGSGLRSWKTPGLVAL